jgi:hypothetical protein
MCFFMRETPYLVTLMPLDAVAEVAYPCAERA